MDTSLVWEIFAVQRTFNAQLMPWANILTGKTNIK